MANPQLYPLGEMVNDLQGSGNPQPSYDSGYWSNGDIISDWWNHKDTFAHNEALAAWERESSFNAQEAQKARDFEQFMSNTQMQRKVADYLKAGYSPLAALEGNGSYSVSSAPAASAHARGAANGGNNFGALLGALMMTMANFVTKGISGAASNAANASKAAVDQQKLDILRDKIGIQREWLELAKNGRSSKVDVQRSIRKASNDNLKGLDWDKMLDELDNL